MDTLDRILNAMTGKLTGYVLIGTVLALLIITIVAQIAMKTT